MNPQNRSVNIEQLQNSLKLLYAKVELWGAENKDVQVPGSEGTGTHGGHSEGDHRQRVRGTGFPIH